jgi:aryl-phospho-beta-D-glucosidase BglC (GH1 family)
MCKFTFVQIDDIKSIKALDTLIRKKTRQGVNMERFLKAVGKDLRNHKGTGDIVTLRGTNVGGWQVMEGWMCPTNAVDQKTAIHTLIERFGKDTAEDLIKLYETSWLQEIDFDHIKDLNFNVLRLPFSYLNLLDDEGRLRPDTLATYDWFVEQCAKRDIYVILDLHAAPGSQNGKDHSGDTSGSKLYSVKEYQDLTVSLWEQLAKHYKGNPTIAGYDLLNEPEGNEHTFLTSTEEKESVLGGNPTERTPLGETPSERTPLGGNPTERTPWGWVQFPFYDRLYKAIRAIDPDHLIIMEAIWEPTDMRDPKDFGWDNVMYQYHCYGWDGIDDVEKQKNFTDTKVKLMQQANFNVPVHIGEFTLFSQPESWEYALDIYGDQGWSWTTWTYKTVEYGNWGIFNSTKLDTPDVDINSDSLETIKDKWGRVGTATSFKKNEMLYELLKKKAGQSYETNLNILSK